MKYGFISTLVLLFLLQMSLSTSNASTIQLPKTGQTICYDTAGTVITCAGTGQDGDKQAGVAWPSPRFIDNYDGTVADNMTGLVWLKTPTVSANWTGRVLWQRPIHWWEIIPSAPSTTALWPVTGVCRI